MSRVTYKMVKEWLQDSPFAVTHGMVLHCWDGYYRILDSDNNIVCAGATPNECWREFTLYKSGYYLAMREMGK